MLTTKNMTSSQKDKIISILADWLLDSDALACHACTNSNKSLTGEYKGCDGNCHHKNGIPSTVEDVVDFVAASAQIKEEAFFAEAVLREYLTIEVPFRLAEIHGITNENLSELLVEDGIQALLDDSKVIFNYDKIDDVLSNIISAHGLDPTALDD